MSSDQREESNLKKSINKDLQIHDSPQQQFTFLNGQKHTNNDTASFSFVKRSEVPKAIVSFLKKNNSSNDSSSTVSKSSDDTRKQPSKDVDNDTSQKSPTSSSCTKDINITRQPISEDDDERIRRMVDSQNERLNNLGRSIKITRPLKNSSTSSNDGSKSASTTNEIINENKNMLSKRRNDKGRSYSPSRRYSHDRENRASYYRERRDRSPSPYRYSTKRSPSPRYRQSRSPIHGYYPRSPSPYYRSRSPLSLYDSPSPPTRYYSISPPRRIHVRSPSPLTKHRYDTSLSPPPRRRYSRSPSPKACRRYNRSPYPKSRLRCTRSPSPARRRRYDRSVSLRYRSRSPVSNYRSRSPSPFYRKHVRSFSPKNNRNKAATTPISKNISGSSSKQNSHKKDLSNDRSIRIPKDKQNRDSLYSNIVKYTSGIDKVSKNVSSDLKTESSSISKKISSKEISHNTSGAKDKNKPIFTDSKISDSSEKSKKYESTSTVKNNTGIDKKKDKTVHDKEKSNANATYKKDSKETTAVVSPPERTRRQFTDAPTTVSSDNSTPVASKEFRESTTQQSATTMQKNNSQNSTLNDKNEKPTARQRRTFTDTPPTIQQQVSASDDNKKEAANKQLSLDKSATAPKNKFNIMGTPSTKRFNETLRQLSIEERDDVVMDILPSPPPLIKIFNINNESLNKNIEEKVAVELKKELEASKQYPSTTTSTDNTEGLDLQQKSTTSGSTDSNVASTDKSNLVEIIKETVAPEGDLNENEKGSQLVPDNSNMQKNDMPLTTTQLKDIQASNTLKDATVINSTNTTDPLEQSTAVSTIPVSSTSVPMTPTKTSITTPTPVAIDPLSRPKKKRTRLPLSWKVKMSDEGDIYYVNSVTGEESFTRPEI